MPAGRAPRPGARGVHAIEEPALLLPDPIAIDTSFMVEALIESQPLHGACKAFSDRVADVGVRVVASELLGIELAEAAFAIALKERWGGQWRRHRTDGRARRRARRLLIDATSRFETYLDSVDHVLIPVGGVADDATLLMADHGLASYDAVHAASATAAGAGAIVTTDAGFALLPPALLAIYTDRSRVARCRMIRPR